MIAVNQMDQTTQQNAAMVEETNAAAGVMSNKAGNLQQLVAQFILGGAGAQANALRRVGNRMAQPVAHGQPRPHAHNVAVQHGNAAVAQEWGEFDRSGQLQACLRRQGWTW